MPATQVKLAGSDNAAAMWACAAAPIELPDPSHPPPPTTDTACPPEKRAVLDWRYTSPGVARDQKSKKYVG